MGVFDKASLALVPDGIKDGKLYSIKPTDGSGDFTFTRGSNLAATRVDENGLIEKGRENLLLQSNQFDTSPWTDPNADITGGQEGRDGGNDAWELSLTGAFGQTAQFVSTSGVNTLSFYAKSGTSDFVRPYIAGPNKYAYFDLLNGQTGTQTGVASSIEDAGNGWWRCSFTVEGTITDVRLHVADSISTIGTSTSGTIYIQDAQLEQGLVATEYLDTSTGVNKLLYSNNFEKPAWYKGVNYTVTPDQEGHDGTTNAYLLDKIAAGNHYFRQMDVNVDGQATTSIYAKAGTASHLMFYLNGVVRVNLNNGDVESTGGVFESYNVERIGRNGWWRISLTIASHPSFVYFKPQIGNNVDGTGSIYIQHAQTNEGADTLPYVETQGVTAYAGVLEELPRIDYSGSTPSLLLEPSRTNLVEYSEYFESTSWWFSTSADVELSDNTSPEGVKNAFKVTYGAGGNRLGGANFGLPNTPHTNSIYMRKVSGSGVVNFANQLGDTNNITLTTDWERYDVTATLVDGTARFYIYLKTFGDVIEVYGAQQEEGSYPTSYIPTYGASVTRGAEIANTVSIPSLIGQTEGTFLLDFEYTGFELGAAYNWIALESENGHERILIYKNANSTDLLVYLSAKNSMVFVKSIATISANTRYKIAFRYSTGDQVIYLNGILKHTSTHTYTRDSDLSRVTFNESNNPASCRVHQAVVLKGALSNDELAALTTL